MASRSGTPEVAFVLPSWGRADPPPPHYAELLKALDELGVRTEVIAAELHPLVNPEQPPPGSRGLFLSPSFVPALLRSSAPVLLCVEYSVATALCVVVARVRGKRTIIFQEHCGREGQRLPRWERGYRRLLGTLAHALVANTDAAYAELADVLRIDRRKIFRATLLVPPERTALVREAGSVPRASRRPLFLFVGRLEQRKNVGGLLDAAAALRAHGSEFEVWIVGAGSERSKLEAQAAPLIGEGVVRFLGSQPNSAIGAAYEAADVFVMPSFRDYRSVAVLEALRFGKPVIESVRDGNAGDFVRHEVTGLVFDPYEPGALAAAMERAINEPNVFQEFGRRASALMEEQTPRTAAAALRDILTAVQAA